MKRKLSCLIGSLLFWALMPVLLEAQSAARIGLSWDPVTTYSDGTALPPSATIGYNVYRGVLSDGSDGAKINPAPVMVANYLDSAVSINKIYFYSVTAVNTSVIPATESGHSNIVPGDTHVLQKPGGLVGTVTIVP